MPQRVIGDPRRLKQIMFNLIGNAIKFTEQGGVEVTACFSKNKLLLTVKDSGIGISEDKLEKIMQPFYQVDQSSVRKYGGTGLGLTIVSRILEKLKGTIKIESKLNQGTTIYIVFPVKTTDNASSLSEVAVKTPASLQGLKILVVEDDPVSIKYIGKILKDVGADFQIADSFASLRQICDSGMVPDCVLLDLSLPDTDGFECLNWLRNKYAGQKIKCIAQTAHVLYGNVQRCKEAGFDDFIGKPYRKNDFIDIIAKNLCGTI